MFEHFQHRLAAISLNIPVALAFFHLTLLPAGAQGFYVGSGWDRTDATIAFTSGYGGFADAYTDRPYAYAYIGGTDTSAHADATYEQTWTWTGGGSPLGTIQLNWAIWGTVGFFQNPVNHIFASVGYASEAGPPDYGGSAPYQGNTYNSASNTTVYAQAYVAADIQNFGHASGEVNVYVY